MQDIDSISFIVERAENNYGTITSIETNTVRLFQDIGIFAFSVEFSQSPKNIRFMILKSLSTMSMTFPFFQVSELKED